MADSVHCRADHNYPGRPIGFCVGEQDHQVHRVLKEWRSPEGKGYLIRTEENTVYVLFWRSAAQLWEIRAAELKKESL
jgi:hypothetical protein